MDRRRRSNNDRTEILDAEVITIALR